MAEPKEITKDEYQQGFIDFYQPFNIVDPTITTPVDPLPDLGEVTGISTTVDKPYIDVNINKINDPNSQEKNKNHFNILSGTSFSSSDIKYNTINDMTKSLNLDKTGPMSAEKVLLAGPSSLMGFAASGDYGFGERLEGPTGASVFSAGKISEVALDRHMQNFSATKDAYTELKNQLSTGSVGSATEYFKIAGTDMGFAAVIGGMHFSRSPNVGRYDGHFGHLHSNAATAHNMLKSMEALSKGLDPRGGGGLSGYQIGSGADNSDNRGASDARLSNNMGAITEDGYYTYVSGADLGHTKSKLYGGNLSRTLADQLRATGKYGAFTEADMVAAMAAARKKGSKGFTAEMSKYLLPKKSVDSIAVSQDNSQIYKWEEEATTDALGNKVNLKTLSAVTSLPVSDVAGQGITGPMPTKPVPASTFKSKITFPDETDDVGGTQYSTVVVRKPEKNIKPATVTQEDIRKQDARREEAEQNRAKAREEQRVKDVLADRSRGIQRGFNTGGSIGNLANMLRTARLGYNQGGAVQSGYYGYQEGGEINMQEIGFVNGKTPDQVTEAQTVADTEPMTVEEGDFVINAAAVELIGVDTIVGLVSDALQKASEEGVSIVDIPVDIDSDQMVDVLVSEGEFIVPRELIPFIEGGMETLERINDQGKPEVDNRIAENQMMLQNDMAMQEEPVEPQMPPEDVGNIPPVQQLEVQLDADKGFV